MQRALCLVLTLLVCVATRVGAQSLTTQPNIVLIVTDDQRWDTVQYMPNTKALLANLGTTFTNAFAETPVCCPSRATIFTGRKSHRHGVISNEPPEGGAPKFDDSSTISTWLDGAGYRTGLFGKNLNNYDDIAPYVPPGWDEWHAFVENHAYYNYTMVENGVMVPYGSQPTDYSTDVIARKSVDFILATPPTEPLFLYFAPFAPHAPYTPAPGDENLFSDLAPWRPRSYNEADVSDKPQWVRNLRLLTASQQASGDLARKNQLRSLQAVDRAVARIVEALQLTGRLANTVFIFTSDNGYSWGEHRWLNNKWCVYEECARVPLLVHGPGIAARQEPRLVSTIDLAPTIAELAGVPRSSTEVNGRSLVSILRNPSSSWRTGCILIEMRAPSWRSLYWAVRCRRYTYVEHDNGNREFYDLKYDPLQLRNQVNNPAWANIITWLQRQLATLKAQ